MSAPTQTRTSTAVAERRVALRGTDRGTSLEGYIALMRAMIVDFAAKRDMR